MTRLAFLISLLTLTAFGGTSCKKVNKLVQFNLDYKTEITVPASAGVNLPFNLFTPNVETNSEASFKANDTRKDLVDEIMLTELKMTIKSPQDGDFSFLESAKVFITAADVEEKEIATTNSVPENIGSVLLLETLGADLAPYLKADRFTLKVRTITDELLSEDYKIEVYSKFHVIARLVNAD